MTPKEFIQMISDAVRDELSTASPTIAAAVRDAVHNAPPKKFTVQRTDEHGRRYLQREVSLPEMLAENTDQLKVQNLLMRQLIYELSEQRKIIKSIQRDKL
jgi:hypothetical protein